MITRHHGERITYTVPRGLSEARAAIVEYAVAAYGFLLNTSERRLAPHSWAEFAELIESHYAASPQRDAVTATLRGLEVSV